MLFYFLSFNYWIQHYKLFVSKRELYPEPFSESYKTAKMECFVKLVNGF